MDTVASRPMTLEAFLAWEEEQDEKYEFDGEQPILMTGGTIGHNIICGNIVALLWSRLRGTPCRPYFADVKVTPPDRSRYPDVIVSCSPVVASDTIEHAPVVLFEVLSPSTRVTDRVAKNAEYRSIPSVRRYVMLEQARVAAVVASRSTLAGGEAVWVEHPLAAADAVLDMPEIGARLILGELYAGLELG